MKLNCNTSRKDFGLFIDVTDASHYDAVGSDGESVESPILKSVSYGDLIYFRSIKQPMSLYAVLMTSLDFSFEVHPV